METLESADAQMHADPAGAATRMVHRLRLAAAPTFAVMAGATGMFGHGAASAMCPAAPSPLGGMALMYALMCIFHLAPWLRWIAARLDFRRS